MDYYTWAQYHSGEDGDNDQPKKETKQYCYHHEFPDTGMLKSWCKHCGKEGFFCRKTQKYKDYEFQAQSNVSGEKNES